MNPDLESLVRATGGVIVARRQPPSLGRRLRRLTQSGDLASPLPGVFVAPDQAQDPLALAKAAQAYYPDAVLVGAIAARLTYWPRVPISTVTLAQRRDVGSHGLFRFQRRRVPADLICEVNGLRCSVPALTALDLANDTGGESIDQVLRTRHATLAGLHEALKLSAHRAGNPERARWLLDSRSEPWSRAEREAHRLLRAHDILGWQANFRVICDGLAYFLDLAFPQHRLAAEIDGRAYHSDVRAFERDRERQNAVVLGNWRLLRFTWSKLTEHPDYVVNVLRRALGSA